MKLHSILVPVVMLAILRPAYPQQTPIADPGVIQKHDTDTFQHFEIERRLEKLRQEQAAESAKKVGRPASKGSAQNAEKFLLQRVTLNPSELLSPGEIHAVLAEYEGRQVSLADLNQLVEQINHLYERKGYTTARAILPAQRITNGEVKITLVEGHVGRVSISNKTRTRDSYILDSVRLKPGRLLRVDDLQRNLTFLNNTSDIKVKAVLEPGSSFGTSDVNLRVEEPPNQRAMLLFDNAGRDGVGNNRVGLVERYGSVLGLRDPLLLGEYWATGTLDSFASYNIPIDSWGTRLGANLDYNRIHILSGPAASFGIAGTSMDIALRLYQPLVERPRLQLSASLSADYIQSRIQSQNVPLSNTMVHSYGVTTEAQIFDHKGLWSANQTVTFGVHDLGGTRSFFKYNGSVVRVQNMAWGLVGVVRFTGQTNAWNYLPPIEQFQVGGVATVRGYPEGRQIGDRGYSGSAELQIPAPFQHWRIGGSRLGQKLKEAVFFDNGAVYDSYRKFNRPPNDDRYLTSVGSGLILNISKYLSGRLDLGVPLRNTVNIPHCRLDFYFQSNPPLAGVLGKAVRAWWGPT